MTKFALDPFKKGKKTEVEGVRKVRVEGDSELIRAIEQHNSLDENMIAQEITEHISILEEIILSPKKIDQFLKYVIDANLTKESVEDYSNITGAYITKLIQDSYNNGSNNFVLHTQNNFIGNIGYMLIGKENNKVNVEINGNIGRVCGANSEYIDFITNGETNTGFGKNAKYSNFTINGNVKDYCGWYSENSNFVINGTVKDYCGRNSKRSNFTINGDVRRMCGKLSEYSYFTINGSTEQCCGEDAKRSNFIITKDTGYGCGHKSEDSNFTINGDVKKNCGYDSKCSVYKTHNKETYEKILNFVPESNTIQLLGPDGEVLKEVKK